jgi:hypothetical protein
MGPKDDVALSFDGTAPGVGPIPQHRRPVMQQQRPQMGRPMGGPGGNAGLQFMSFDAGSTSNMPPPRVPYGAGGYGGGGSSGGFGAFEDEPPLLEGIDFLAQLWRFVLCCKIVVLFLTEH